MPTKINLVVPPDSPTVFANHAFTQMTPTEIIIRFCLIDPERGGVHAVGDESQSLSEVEAPAAVSVFLPVRVAGGLVGAVEKQLEAWREQQKQQKKEASDGE
ncbi:MAG: hypothetical protein FJX75_25330 [Armatimonadetes bacterium]|nr:hypothetical protein [Armatimonadota bacterium]